MMVFGQQKIFIAGDILEVSQGNPLAPNIWALMAIQAPKDPCPAEEVMAHRLTGWEENNNASETLIQWKSIEKSE